MLPIDRAVLGIVGKTSEVQGKLGVRHPQDNVILALVRLEYYAVVVKDHG